MRFQEYLNEREMNTEELFETIGRECKPFMRQIRDHIVGGLLLSGRKRKDDGFESRVRKNRMPKDTPQEIHEYLDDKFHERFGIRARSQTLFCTPDRRFASDFGKVYIIIPKGKFEVIGSPVIYDFFGDVVDGGLNFELLVGRSESDAIAAVEDIYYEEYGESENGNGIYRGEEVGHRQNMDRNEAAERVLTDILNVNVDEISSDKFEMMLDSVGNELEGGPEITLDEFIKKQKDGVRNELEDIMDTYKKGHLQSALDYNHEIMLFTDKYYALNFMELGKEFMDYFDIDAQEYGFRTKG